MSSLCSGDTPCTKNRRKSTKIKGNQEKTNYRPRTVTMELVRPLRRLPGADSGTNRLRKLKRCQWWSELRRPWSEMAGNDLWVCRIPQKWVQNPTWIIPAELIERARILKLLRESQSNPKAAVKARWNKSKWHRSWRRNTDLDASPAQILKGSFY